MFIIALMNFHFFRALASMECHVLELQDFPPNGQPSPLSCSRAPAMIRRIKSYYLVEGKQTQLTALFDKHNYPTFRLDLTFSLILRISSAQYLSINPPIIINVII